MLWEMWETAAWLVRKKVLFQNMGTMVAPRNPMKLKQRLASSPIPIIATAACFAILLIAVFVMPGRSGRVLSPTTWLGTMTFGAMCLFGRNRVVKFSGGGMTVALCLLSMFSNSMAEVLLYLVGSGTIIYGGIPMLIFALVLVYFAPATTKEESSPS